MAIKRYAAAGGVVIQQAVIPELSPDTPYVLLLDRPERGEVRLPKGHIDPGENAEETALRETVEETGFVDLRIEADLGSQVVEFDYKKHHYIRQEHYFLMCLQTPRRVPRNHVDEAQFIVRWATFHEALTQLTFEAEREMLRRAIARYDGQCRNNQAGS
jgi:8-oxo-dGTP pyrophosphatase MutT (NUDIX family)